MAPVLLHTMLYDPGQRVDACVAAPGNRAARGRRGRGRGQGGTGGKHNAAWIGRREKKGQTGWSKVGVREGVCGGGGGGSHVWLAGVQGYMSAATLVPTLLVPAQHREKYGSRNSLSSPS